MGAAVLDERTAHDLRFGEIDVEGRSADLRQPGDEENHQSQGKHQNIGIGPLLLHDLDHVQRLGQHGDGDDHHDYRDLVADQLGRRSETSQGTVLVGGPPTGQHQAKDSHHGKRDYVKQAQIAQVLQYQILSARDGDPNHERRHHDQDRGYPKYGFLRRRGNDVFFEDQFQGVGHRLHQPHRAGPGWPQSPL